MPNNLPLRDLQFIESNLRYLGYLRSDAVRIKSANRIYYTYTNLKTGLSIIIERGTEDEK